MGTGDPPVDVDNLVDTVAAIGATGDVLNTAYAGGADPTGGADSTAAIQAAINAMVSAGGGIVYLPSGTYTVSSTLTCATYGVYVQGAGISSTFINFTGTGDCFRMYSPAFVSGTTVGGGITGLTIDGSGAGAASTGIHMGDIDSLNVSATVKNFSGAGSIGYHFDNANHWTERLYGRIRSFANAAAVVFDVSGATTSTASFARLDLEVIINQSAIANDGVVLQAGAVIYDGHLGIRGNFTSGTAPTTAVLRVTGQVPAGHPGASSSSAIYGTRLDIGVEADAVSTMGPYTIFEGTPGANFICGTYGVLDFSAGAGTFRTSNLATGTGATLASGALWHMGPISGDPTLCPAANLGQNHPMLAVTGALLYHQAPLDTNGTAYTHAGDFFRLTLTANTTISLTGGTFAQTPGAPQRIAFVLTQASSGGPWTVTWPSSGSPTVSSPTVIWANGATPVMSATAGATDMYRLETADGATWYGTAIQQAPLGIASGGTGQATRQAALDALAGAVTSADYLRGNGTHVAMSPIQAADLPAATTSVQGAVVLDGTAADIQPDGVQAAGATGKAPDAGHVHQTYAFNSLWAAPAGATAETFPRRLGTVAGGALTSGTLYVSAIGLPTGLAVSSLTMATSSSTKGGGSHGWYVLLDSSRIVRAVTADQTDLATVWGSPGSAYTLSTNAFTTTYSGLYYAGIMVAASTMPTIVASAAPLNGMTFAAPLLCGSSGTALTTAPALGSTMASISASGSYSLYAYTS